MVSEMSFPSFVNRLMETACPLIEMKALDMAMHSTGGLGINVVMWNFAVIRP